MGDRGPDFSIVNHPIVSFPTMEKSKMGKFENKTIIIIKLLRETKKIGTGEEEREREIERDFAHSLARGTVND